MKCGFFTFALLAMTVFVPVQSTSGVIDKVMTMLADLATKIEGQEAAAKTTFEKFSETCKTQSVEYGQQISTSKAEIEELTASVSKETALESKFSSEIEDLAGSIGGAESDLKAASTVRSSEATEFAKEEKELLETISVIERAITVLSRELSAGASMLQVKSAGNLVQALNAMVQASVLTQADASRLTALTQTSEDSDSDMLSAPAGAVYESKSGSIVETLESLMEKAEAQLAEARKAEATSIHNFQMLEQSLTDEIKYATEDMSKAKLGMHASKEAKGVAEGDLSVSSKDLSDTTALLTELEHDCATSAEEYEEAKKSRAEELAAVKKATAVLKEAMSASFVARDQKAVSFVQLQSSKIASSVDLAHFEAVRFVRNLARKQHSAMLAQLASRMSSAMKMGVVAGQDPFAKVKGLISDMIERLESSASAEESHKAYCDEQMTATKAKKDTSVSEIQSLTVAIEQTTAHAAKLTEQVADLQKELLASSKATAEAGAVRQEEHAEFVSSEAELDKGLEGVKSAVTVLSEYYAKDKASEETAGAAGGVLSLLEVIESDLTKSLVEIKQVEESAAAEYEEMTTAVKFSTLSKEQDVKYKTKELAGVNKRLSELKGDAATEQTELDATLEYFDKLSEECTAKAEPYEARKAAREAEIAGLKQALSILEGETVLLQQKVSKRSLRGLQAHKF